MDVAVTCPPPPGHGEVCLSVRPPSPYLGSGGGGQERGRNAGHGWSYRHWWLQVAHTRLVLLTPYACLVGRKRAGSHTACLHALDDLFEWNWVLRVLCAWHSDHTVQIEGEQSPLTRTCPVAGHMLHLASKGEFFHSLNIWSFLASFGWWPPISISDSIVAWSLPSLSSFVFFSFVECWRWN